MRAVKTKSQRGETVEIGVRSDKGIVREKNEDSYCILPANALSPLTFIIADGMGGHNSGEIASRMAIEIAKRFMLKFNELYSQNSNVVHILKSIVDNMNCEIFNKSKLSNLNTGMGTTLILSILFEDKLYICHIGDSRAYVFRDNNLIRLTNDHSYIEELLRNGSITPEEAQTHPKKNMITKAVGCFATVEPDIYTLDVEKNDILLFCTDGLTNMLCDEEIRRLITRYDDLDQLCQEFIKIANERGGDDNITVILYKKE